MPLLDGGLRKRPPSFATNSDSRISIPYSVRCRNVLTEFSAIERDSENLCAYRQINLRNSPQAIVSINFYPQRTFTFDIEIQAASRSINPKTTPMILQLFQQIKSLIESEIEFMPEIIRAF